MANKEINDFTLKSKPESTDSTVVQEVGGTTRRITIGNINLNYDYVVDSQTAFDTLVASGTWLDAKNVLFTASVTRAALTIIPATVEKIHAINGATLTATSLPNGHFGIGYSSLPTDPKFEIIGLNVVASGTGEVYSFYRCANIRNCSATVTGSTNAIGFYGSNNLNECISTATGTSGTGSGYYSCNNLVNCTGTGTGGTAGYAFNACNYAFGCRKGSASTTSTWGGANTKIRGCEDISDDA